MTVEILKKDYLPVWNLCQICVQMNNPSYLRTNDDDDDDGNYYANHHHHHNNSCHY